jgi:gas vesicle protein
MARRQVNRYFEGLVAGGVLGIVIGLLGATKTGKEFRKDLKALYKDLSKTALDSYADIKVALAEPNSEGHAVVDRGKRLVDNFMGNNSGPVYTPGRMPSDRSVR